MISSKSAQFLTLRHYRLWKLILCPWFGTS